jgi:DNA polymerase I-like protein with 3'-5' exonuclease and polymerase domains
MKRAMIRVEDMLRKKYEDTYPVLTLHDELPIEGPISQHKKCGSKLMQDIIQEMQVDSKRLGLPVPLPIKMKLSMDKWSTAEGIQV